MSEKSIHPLSQQTIVLLQKGMLNKYSIAIVKFNGNCLNQDNLSFIHGNIVKFI